MIPVIIIHRDRPTWLKKCINSIGLIDGVYPVVHDNGTTYPLGVEYLKELEKSGVRVYRNDVPQTMDSISKLVKLTINKELKLSESDYYIVTDCDIELCDSVIQGDMIGFYKFLLDKFPGAKCVGPMLRIDDLPVNEYVNEQKKWHILQFWHKTPEMIKWRDEYYDYQKAFIDTTFAMYRKNFEFHRLNEGIRTYFPFWARHLDWYINPESPNEERIYYMNNCSNKVSTSTRHYKEWGFIK